MKLLCFGDNGVLDVGYRLIFNFITIGEIQRSVVIFSLNRNPKHPNPLSILKQLFSRRIIPTQILSKLFSYLFAKNSKQMFGALYNLKIKGWFTKVSKLILRHTVCPTTHVWCESSQNLVSSLNTRANGFKIKTSEEHISSKSIVYQIVDGLIF